MNKLECSDTCYLFSIMIEVIMLYGGELWGMLRSEKMEGLFLWFCKFVLSVPITCATMAVYSELGRIPFLISSRLKAVKYFERLSSSNCPLLTQHGFEVSKSLKLHSFYSSITKQLQEHNLLKSFDIDKYGTQLVESFLKEWSNSILVHPGKTQQLEISYGFMRKLKLIFIWRAT